MSEWAHYDDLAAEALARRERMEDDPDHADYVRQDAEREREAAHRAAVRRRSPWFDPWD